jgi:hypothetical protein
LILKLLPIFTVKLSNDATEVDLGDSSFEIFSILSIDCAISSFVCPFKKLDQ